MLSRRTCLATAAGAALAAPLAGWRTAEPTRAQGLATMARATRFITDEVAVAGGNVWFYLTDLSRRWGEMEACPTMMRPQASASVATLVLGLNAEAYGQVELQTTSHPHRGPGPASRLQASSIAAKSATLDGRLHRNLHRRHDPADRHRRPHTVLISVGIKTKETP